MRVLGANQGEDIWVQPWSSSLVPLKGAYVSKSQEKSPYASPCLMSQKYINHGPWLHLLLAFLPHQGCPAHIYSAFTWEASISFWFFLCLELRVYDQEIITTHQTFCQVLAIICCELHHHCPPIKVSTPELTFHQLLHSIYNSYVDCQVVKIWKQLRARPLSRYVRSFLGRFK